MASSLITDKFRIQLANVFKNSLTTDNYYLFISRSSAWNTQEYTSTPIVNESNPPTALDSDFVFNQLYDNMIAIKKINASDLFKVINRINWTANTSYDQYKHDYSPTKPSATGEVRLNNCKFYVMNSTYQVFKCISNNQTPENPNGTLTAVGAEPNVTGSPTAIITTSDGYKWKFLYQITPQEILDFSTAEFIPVKTNSTVSLGAIAGAIDNINILNRSSTPLISGTYFAKIDGDGTGGVVRIIVPNDVNNVNDKKISIAEIVSSGSGYTFASVDLTKTYTTAALTTPVSCGITTNGKTYIEVIISPFRGHGAAPENELGAYKTILNGVLDSIDGNGDIPIGISFRQFGVMVNPIINNSTSPFISPSGSVCYSIKLPATFTGTFINGEKLTQAVTNAVGVVIGYDPINKIVRYYQNKYTTTNDNLVRFSGANAVSGDTVVNGGSGSSETPSLSGVFAGSTFVDGYANPEITPKSGEILYYENRVAINRSQDQIENIKLVFEF